MKGFTGAFEEAMVDKTVFFLHIPRCAGTTFVEEVLKNRYAPEAILVFYGRSTRELIDRLKTMSPEAKRELRCVAGHFAFGVHRWQEAPPPAYLTVVRNPVERIVSHYRFVLRRPDHYLHRSVIDGDMSLKDYLLSGLSPELDNGQTRLLAGLGWGAPLGHCPRSMLDQARTNLAEYFFEAGTTERFEVFLERLRRKWGWEVPACNRRNTAPEPAGEDTPNPATRKLIEDMNGLDMELYDFIASRFERS